MTSKGIEKFTINAGTAAIIGIINAAIYILLKHNNPSARLAKFSGFPSFAIFFETTLRPDTQREFSIL
jgi:hypothetical protein